VDIVGEDSADVAESPDAEADEPEEAIVFDDELDEDDYDEVVDDEDDFTESLGMEIDDEEEGVPEVEDDFSGPEVSATEDVDIPEQISLSPAQIDEAVERVITNMYSDKIEGIIVSAIEKAVTREIDKIKAALLED